MRGSKHDAELKEKVLAECFATGNKAKVAKKYGLPETTVGTWVINLERSTDAEIVELRKKRKEKFIENAWGIIEKTQKLINKKLDDDDISKDIDVGKLSTVMGTMYDKQALAGDEPTEIICTKLEDFAE